MAIECTVDTPLLRKLYDEVKDNVESYEALKHLVTIWWDREVQKDPDYEYDSYPTAKEVIGLKNELRAASKENISSDSSVENTINSNSISPSEYFLSSGDAIGSDAAWTSAAIEAGITEKRNFSTKSYDALSEAEKTETETEYLKAVEKLKKTPISSSTYVGKLVRRDWLQVKNADAVFAIGRILDKNEIGNRKYVNTTDHKVVDGGTGYAVQMAINNNKPVHVFDQTKNQWFIWDGNDFIPEDTPVLTRRFAGIGTRELNDSGRKAIKDVFNKTFENKSTDFKPENSSAPIELAIDPNTLEAQADIAFGTPQRRRDVVNILVNAIRMGFDFEFNFQKKNLQNRINNESDETKRAELQNQLDTLTVEKAVSVGIDNIIKRVRRMFNPEALNPEKYSNYDELVDGFTKIQDNWNTLIEEAFDILKVTDGFDYYGDIININYDTPIDEESGEFFDDDSLKEETYKDSWMEKARFVDQRDSLSQKVRKILWTTPKVDAEGNPEYGYLGFPRYLQSDYVHSTLLQELGQARNTEHFWQLLNELSGRKKWVKPIIDKLNADESVKSQFYQNFRKEFMPYWIQVQKKTENSNGEVTNVLIQTKRVNKIPGIMHMLDEWRDNYEEGSKLDEYSIYREGQQLDKENAKKASAYLDELLNNYPEDVKTWIEEDENLAKVMRVLHMAGITAEPEVVREVLKGEDLEDGTQLLNELYNRLSAIFKGVVDGKVKETISNDGSIIYDDLLNKFDSAYTVIARILDTIPEDSILSSFRESGKSFQSYSAPSYLGKLINNLKNIKGNSDSLQKFYGEQFMKYKWFYSEKTGWKSSWLKQLYNSKSKRDLLDRKIVMHSGKLEFNDWGNKEYAIAMISEYYSTTDNNSAWYYIPLLADAESAEFLKFTKYTNSSEKDESSNPISYEKLILRDLEDVVRQEFDRIMLVRQREGKVNPIANFDIVREENGEERDTVRNSNGDIISRNSGNEFKFFPALNTYRTEDGSLFVDTLAEKILRNSSDVSSFIQKALNDIMNEGFNKFLTSVHESGADAVSNGKSVYFQVKESELTETLKNFYWNNTLAQSQIIQLTTTDIAYYKNMKDFQKRFKEIYAQTLKLNIDATFNGEKVGNQWGKAVYLKDSKIEAPSKEALSQMLDGRVEAGILAPRDKDAIMNHFNKINVADAQAYRTLNSYRKVLIMAGRWTQEMEDVKNRLESDTWNIGDFFMMWQTLKPFMYTQTGRPSGIDDYGEIKVPSQYKNSEFLLLALYNTITTPIQKSEKLKAINAFMEKNEIDIVMFESAVKAGNQAPINLKNVESYDDTFNLLDSSIKNSDGSENLEVVHLFDYEDYGIQVETPEHMIDKYQLFGTQIRKLITSDMGEDAEFEIGGKTLKKQDWWSFYNSLITANIVDSYKSALGEFDTIEHIAEIVQRELKGNTRYSDEIRKACELIEVVNPITGETEKQFNLPLYDPVQSDRVQHLLNSIIKKKITKQTIKGGTGIQVSAYGLTDELKIVYEGEGKNRRMKYMECYLPAYSQKFFAPYMKYKEENGKQVGFIDANSLPEELRKIIGYRIPTEDKYSMAPLYIKGFLPQQNGSMIMLPAEITELTGSDFDIDKFYLMFPEFNAYESVNVKSLLTAFKNTLDYTPTKDELNIAYDMVINGNISFSENDLEMKLYDFYTEHKNEFLEKKIKYVKYDFSKSVRDNSVQQRNNQIINMIWGVLTSADTVDKQLNPGNFDKAKVAARICNIATNASPKELMKILGVDKVEKCYDALVSLSFDELDKIAEIFLGVFDPLSPETQLFFHNQNATGGKMIGIYANNNANHALAQHTRLSCIPFVIDGKEYSSLHDIKNNAGNYITRNMSNFLAASVDNVKDPVLKDLMQNPITGNLACLMLRAGVEPNEVGLFLNQPIIKIIVDNLAKGDYGARKDIIKTTIDSWADKRKWKTSPEDAERYKKLLSSDLFNAILFEKEMDGEIDENATKGQKGWYNFQLYVGNAFKEMYKTAEDLAELTEIMKADTAKGSAGPGIAETFQKINRIIRFYNKQKSRKSHLINANLIDFHSPRDNEDIYDTCMDTTLPFMNAFTIAGLGGTIKMLSKYFPFFNSSIYNMIYDEEHGLINYVSEGKTSAKFINTVLNDLMVYVMSKTKFFGSYTDNDGVEHFGLENRRKFIIDFPKRFEKILKENPDIAENRFVSRLRVKYPKRGDKKSVPIQTIVFRNSGKLSIIQRDMYSRDWLSLLYSSNPEAVKLGVNLFKYASFLGGFGFGPNSFIHMAPVLLRKAIPEYEQTLRNLMKKDDYTPFIRQFIMNHMDMQELVPEFSESKLKDVVFSNDKKSFTASPKNSNFIRESSIMDKENGDKVISNKLLPFISIIDSTGKVTYYEADFWEITENTPIKYHKINPLGFKGKVLEYEYGAPDLTSVFYKADRFREGIENTTSFEDGYEGLPVSEPKPYETRTINTVDSPDGVEVSSKKEISSYEPYLEMDANGQYSCGFDLDVPNVFNF